MKYSARLEETREGFTLVFPELPELRVTVSDLRSAASVSDAKLNAHLEVLLSRGHLPLRPSRIRRGARHIAVAVQPHHALALQVRWARQEQGLTLQKVASKMGVTRQRIAALEASDCNWTVATLRRLSDALNVELDIVLRPRRK